MTADIPTLIARLREPLIGSAGPVGDRLLREAANALEAQSTELAQMNERIDALAEERARRYHEGACRYQIERDAARTELAQAERDRDDLAIRYANMAAQVVAGDTLILEATTAAAAARTVISEALAEFKAPIDYYDDDVQRAHSILRGVQEATERPGQPGKNGGERAGLVGRESLPVASVAALAATEPSELDAGQAYFATMRRMYGNDKRLMKAVDAAERTYQDTEPSEPSAYARFAKIASRFPADIAKEIGLWMRSAGYDPTEEGEYERWANDYGLPHEFRPVAGHPDDDECTDRRDGTDVTYCGLPRRMHEYPPRSRAVYDAETKGENRERA